MTRDDCIFCRIVARTLPASVVYSDRLVSALMDIRPVNPGHVLVIPNHHVTFLADLDDEAAEAIFRVARKLATALRKSGLRCEGVNLFLADGEAAIQEIMHCHLHVFPRYRGDGFGLTFGPDYASRPSREILKQAAQRIRDAL